ncbi:MAG: sulfite exporter TauE/SafE family protein [Sulfurifustis sp.]
MEWAYTAAGLAVGFVVGLTGMGGGSLMTPILVLFFGFSPSIAVGTDLIYASVTKANGAWAHNRRGNVDWKLVGWLAVGSVPMAALTTFVLLHVELKSQHLGTLISGVLGVALILTAFAILFREPLRKLAHRSVRDETTKSGYRILATVATGATLGVLVTVSSVGAGVLGMVVLLWLYPRIAPVKLVGVDIAHGLLLTAVAGFGHLFQGHVDFALLASLLIGSLPGVYLGSHLSGLFPDKVLRPALACVLLVTGGRLVF